VIQDDLVYDILEPDQMPLKPIDTEIDLDGQFVFPGLINGHDHLVDTCWTGLGEAPAENWFEWDASAKISPEYKDMQRLSVADLYILGMYKNVLSGATTVVDHFPAEISQTFYQHPLTSLLEHLYLAHSVSSKQLHWGRNIVEEYKGSRGVIPFVIHMGQGKDKEIREELEALNRLGALESNTVLVDCCHLNQTDLQLVAAKGSSIVWLPVASERIFGFQPDLRSILELKIPFCIGTDSSITGSGGMLGELKKALKFSQENLEGKLSARDLVKSATIDAAKIFGIEKLVGTIQAGKRADLIVFRCDDDHPDPFKYFIEMKPEHFSIVCHRGSMIVGNDEFRKVSAIDFSQYSEVRVNNSSKILFGHPVQLLERISHKLGRQINFSFFPVQSED
jgi:cytosine/adenosine deaminase-related metal-dependent hydrolase